MILIEIMTATLLYVQKCLLINLKYRKAREIISALNGVWWSKDVTKNRKNMMCNNMVKSVLIYGAETWSLYEDDRRRINGTEMDALDDQQGFLNQIDKRMGVLEKN